MAVVLSPPPTSPAPLTKARDYLARQIGMAVQHHSGPANPEVIERLDGIMAVASARVERAAAGAPQAVKNEAVVRFAGYLRQSDYGGIRREEIGPKSAEYVVNHSAMFRNCGAAALLLPWREHGVGSTRA